MAASARATVFPVSIASPSGAASRGRLAHFIAQHQRGNVVSAIAGYRDVLRVDPLQFDAWRLLGTALLSRQESAAALEACNRALGLRRDIAEVWATRGEALARLGRNGEVMEHPDRIREAIASFESAVRLQPALGSAWLQLSSLRRLLGENELALDALDRARAQGPDLAKVWNNRALILDALRRREEALVDFARALALDPQNAVVWSNQAKVLHSLSRNDEALASLDRGLAIAPDLAVAWSMRGVICAQMNRYDEAREHLQRALQLEPEHREARFNLGMVHLYLGNFDQGWVGYEARENLPGTNVLNLAGAPTWQRGESVSGKTILIHCEQGLGDTIQFCRFAPHLAAMGARVIITVQPPLHLLLADLGENVRVLTNGDPAPAFDMQCWLMSVAHRLAITADTIPSRVPYLSPPAQRVRVWRRTLGLAPDQGRAEHSAGGPLRVGLVVSGNADHANDAHRSIPLERFAAVFSMLGATKVQWHLLQREVRADDEQWLRRHEIADHREALLDFCDTAALACCMDVVISVDTSVAHLAGALGVPLFLLLPANVDWRWMGGREDSPWYPSARLFRQQSLGDWSGPLRMLAAALDEEQRRSMGDRRPSQLPGDAPPCDSDWRDDALLGVLQQKARASLQDSAAQFNLGLRLLALGRLDAGWDYYEWRQWVPSLHTAMPEGGIVWDGSQDLAGKTLLLCHEQGLGDVLQFCRYVPLLAAYGARVLLGVPRPLASLVASVPGVHAVVGGNDPIPPFDYKCLLLSLPQRFGTTLRNIPAQIPYLAAPASNMGRWRERIEVGGHPEVLRIGLVCSGSPTHPNDAQRSIPLAAFAALRDALDGVVFEFHLLQAQVRASDSAALSELGIHDHCAELTDMTHTAALAQYMDAVVSVDTAVAHLCGALGLPLYLLLSPDPDWRWMIGREDSPWYPSVRLFRRAPGLPWHCVLAQVGSVLRAERDQVRGRPGAGTFDYAVPAGALPGLAWRRAPVTPPDLPAMLAGAIDRHRNGDRAGAIASYRTLLAFQPEWFDVLRLLGGALVQDEQAAEALAALDAALRQREDAEEVWAARASALALLGRFAEALESIDRALALQPGKPEYWNTRSLQLQALGRIHEALEGVGRALRHVPDRPEFLGNRAVLNLTLGNLATGWRDFEARLQVREMGMAPLGGIPIWDGRQRLAGRTILLACEQGLGDTLQFCRYAPLLAQRGARVVLGVQPALRALLREMPGLLAVVTEGDSVPAVDLQCWLLSVPHRLGTTLESVPAAVPYLRAPDSRVIAWRERLGAKDAQAALRVGIVASGSADHDNDRYRSIPLAQFEALFATLRLRAARPIQWHLLQSEVRADDETWLGRLGIADHRTDLRDFCETAALASCLDAIVSVDTAAAHLAGALGIPLYLLLPANPDWRWMVERTDSPWYPTARLLRQRKLGDWSDPLASLCQALLEASDSGST